MSNKKLREIEEIKEEIKEPKHDYIEKFATISDDKKSLLLRIPQDIRKHMNMKAGDKIRFYMVSEEDKHPELKIELVRKNA